LQRFLEQEWICRELNLRHRLQQNLENQAGILEQRGDYEEARQRYEEQVALLEELGNPATLIDALGRLIALFIRMNRIDLLIARIDRRIALCREQGNAQELQLSLGQRGYAAMRLGDPQDALRWVREQETICRGLILDRKEDAEMLFNSLCNHAFLLGEPLGRPLESLPIFEEARRLVEQSQLESCRSTLNTKWQAVVFAARRQAYLLRQSGNLDEALALMRGVEASCVVQSDPASRLAVIDERLKIAFVSADFEAAVAVAREIEQAAIAAGDFPAQVRAIFLQGGIQAENLRRPADGLPLLETADQMAQAHGLDTLRNQLAPVLAQARRDLAS
jgi:hypothetical protein